MAGMVTDPVVTTLVMTLPLMVPTRALLTTATLGGPPLTIPRRARDRFMKNRPAPVTMRGWGCPE